MSEQAGAADKQTQSRSVPAPSSLPEPPSHPVPVPSARRCLSSSAGPCQGRNLPRICAKQALLGQRSRPRRSPAGARGCRGEVFWELLGRHEGRQELYPGSCRNAALGRASCFPTCEREPNSYMYPLWPTFQTSKIPGGGYPQVLKTPGTASFLVITSLSCAVLRRLCAEADLGDGRTESCPAEKDLGILMGEKFDMSQQCDLAAHIFCLYSALVRPQLKVKDRTC
ncbi:uncharacterized protein LOC131586918 isoform X2 [Poecile atricapillus]|uniref:uncharacterized protein LOC131586918 isoform X2 n=1 Tax=Poecile atricapillus TaxID=48891 RepID=UPI0027394E30|nr:uncharacterized protein LOC131586918 isoform X2 [Poecile atricapillus]